MRIVRTLLAPALAAVAVAALVGPASGQLTEDNVKDVIKCQEKIKKEGQKFVTTKMKAVQKCVDGFIDADLRLEAGAISPEQHLEALVKAETQCEKEGDKILKASTKFVDNVAKACGPVEQLVTGPDDVLGFQSLILFLNQELGTSITVSNAEELAGVLCIGSELLVDLGVVMQAPRAILDILFLLGNPLDPRCSFGDVLPI